ncbi:glycogen biosynthesis protein GlgD [Neobacillus notoginsengisoli]|uniref:Glycogen biosynthesis protein GlgD n=1 Tax=Neobacillus notoginsengisoli TaxID=1578198 RepID=A0A417YUF1_9BACI|nr:glycogen biosynthesis protein GlgD [Neobacillus notoginsengisoli]RHW40816.1 glycogen biosynthesis protein GlgD [Neobacillus notoginsengisoli]
MKKRSKQNNPEQKTRNGLNSQNIEAGSEFNLIDRAKKAYEDSGGQRVKSKMHVENDKYS